MSMSANLTALAQRYTIVIAGLTRNPPSRDPASSKRMIPLSKVVLPVSAYLLRIKTFPSFVMEIKSLPCLSGKRKIFSEYVLRYWFRDISLFVEAMMD